MAKKKSLFDKILHAEEKPAEKKQEARSEPLTVEIKDDSKKFSEHPKFAKFKGEKK